MLTRESSIELSTRHTHCRNFHPGVTVDQAKASATGSLNILVGLTLKLVHCTTVFG